MPLPPLVTADLSQASLTGTGVFDVLMQANKAHLEAEFVKDRIKGTEYATVYLGSMESVMRSSVEFLLNRDKLSLEAQLIEQQILLAQVQVEKAQAELAILQQTVLKIPHEIALLQAQTANTVAEGLNIPIQGEVLTAQKNKLNVENELVVLEKLKSTAQTELIGIQADNAVLEGLNIPIQGQVLTAQKCKLEAEFDLVVAEKLKTNSEVTLLTQKTATEKAQITALGVDADSVIGRQKALYQAQTNGFTRDAEQKVAKLMTDTWSVRRTTDEGVVADTVNKLDDSTIGRAVNKMLTGIGA